MCPTCGATGACEHLVFVVESRGAEVPVYCAAGRGSPSRRSSMPKTHIGTHPVPVAALISALLVAGIWYDDLLRFYRSLPYRDAMSAAFLVAFAFGMTFVAALFWRRR